tara:strand:+ start:173 stop:553 length:381 start_codon:yes stop_codon:yes gene_type:complete
MSRLRANQITNQSADGAPTVQNGLIVTGVCTATTFKGDGSQLTGVVQSDTPLGNSVASTTFYESDNAVSISTTTTLTRTSSNPGKIYTKFQEVVVGTSSPGSVALVVGAGEELVVDAYGLRTPDNI